VTLSKLLLPPSQAGYGVDFGSSSLYVELSGGPGASRRDFLGNVSRVSVSWSLPSEEADYLLSFRRAATNYESEPFLIDLCIDSADLKEYEAKFIPGTFRLTGYRGNERSYSAELEVKPTSSDADYDAALVLMYDSYGNESNLVLSLLAELVNEDLPR
jgi:hypothetical protein